MDTFNQSAWAQETFSKDFLEKADIYIQERRKMIHSMSSLFSFYFKEKSNIHTLDLGCGDGILTEELISKNGTIIAEPPLNSRTDRDSAPLPGRCG